MLLPAALDNAYKRPAKTIPRVEGEAHELEWVRAAKAGKPAVSNFDTPPTSLRSASSATSPSAWTPASTGTGRT